MANHNNPDMPPPTHLLPRTTQPPSLATISGFVRSIFPILEGDVTFLYHTPRDLPDPPSIPIRKVVLSITPTPGVYQALQSGAWEYNLAFLHRPWALERRRVPRTTTVLACHKAFDQELTVGANFALARKLGLDVQAGRARVLKGYKGDAERRIGIVAPFVGGGVVGAGDVRARVRREFGDGLEGEFGFDDEVGGEGGEAQEGDVVECGGLGVSVVAIMNAFHSDEVDRVAHAALESGLVKSVEECAGVLYLTGAVREEGLAAARAKGMRVICVGHQVCELWGIRHMAVELKQEFPTVDIMVVDEEEEKPAPKKSNIPVQA